MSLYGGPDWSTLDKDGNFDLDPNFGLITDPFRIVAEHVLRRWLIEPGELDIPTIGAGLSRWLNGNLSTTDYDELTARLRSSALEVDGLADIDLQVSPLSDQQSDLVITASISLTNGQNFPTIFSLSADGAIKLIVNGENQ